jgi:hypothetical protein
MFSLRNKITILTISITTTYFCLFAIFLHLPLLSNNMLLFQTPPVVICSAINGNKTFSNYHILMLEFKQVFELLLSLSFRQKRFFFLILSIKKREISLDLMVSQFDRI